MKKILPEFKDDNDKLIILAMVICSMFFVFIPSLIVILGLKNYISDSSYVIAKAFFNFELLLFLIGLLFIIPIIGWIVGFIISPIMVILNVVIVVINICAIGKNSELKIPATYEFL